MVVLSRLNFNEIIFYKVGVSEIVLHQWLVGKLTNEGTSGYISQAVLSQMCWQQDGENSSQRAKTSWGKESASFFLHAVNPQGTPKTIWDSLHACSVSQAHLTLQPHGLWPARLLCPWDSPGKNTEGGCHFLLQGIFPTQGLNPHLQCLLLWQADSLPLSSLGIPYIEERDLFFFFPSSMIWQVF